MQTYPFLPGRLEISRGKPRDYVELARFHYLPGKPATWDQVWTVRFCPTGAGDPRWRKRKGRLIAIAVLSYPSPSCLARRRALDFRGSRNDELRFANRRLRTISRVIVHPQFRAMGLSSELVRWVCSRCTTRYVEAIARMGAAHPFFERGGMEHVKPVSSLEDAYYFFDRNAEASRATARSRQVQAPSKIQ